MSQSLSQACLEGLKKGSLDFPAIPEISLKIRKAIADESINASRLARIIQLDPAITARLIQVANSVLYRGNRTIESCPEAITRMGMKTVQSLVTSIALKSVFSARYPIPTRLLDNLWHHSSYVAAICATMAFKIGGYDPDRAMLAGLIHDIGAIPVLSLADNNAEWASDKTQIRQAMAAHKAGIGASVMQQWGFPEDFRDICLQAENWQRDHDGDADYADLVIIAQLHSYIGTPDMKTIPPMDSLPVFRRLISTGSDPELSLNILEIAKDEIAQLQRMLL